MIRYKLKVFSEVKCCVIVHQGILYPIFPLVGCVLVSDRREAPCVCGVWEGVQSELQSDHSQQEAQQLQTLPLPSLPAQLPEETGPAAPPGDTLQHRQQHGLPEQPELALAAKYTMLQCTERVV